MYFLEDLPGRGLEPLRIAPPDPKSGASANFATLAAWEIFPRAGHCTRIWSGNQPDPRHEAPDKQFPDYSDPHLFRAPVLPATFCPGNKKRAVNQGPVCDNLEEILMHLSARVSSIFCF